MQSPTQSLMQSPIMISRLLPRRARTALLAALLLTPTALRAQPAQWTETAPPLAPGTRLRVDVRGSRAPSTVRLVRATTDTLWVRRWREDPAAGSDDTFAVPLASVRRLQRSRGTHTHVRRNGGYALVGGLFAGAVLGAIEGANDDGEFFDLTPAEGALILGVMLAVPAGMIGALTGLPPTEDWVDVPLPARASVTSSPMRGGLAVRPRLGLTRVPVRGAPAARAITLGLTMRPR